MIGANKYYPPASVVLSVSVIVGGPSPTLVLAVMEQM